MEKFNDYQKASSGSLKDHKELIPPQAALLDWVIGLSGETGEVSELIKHHVFHKEKLDIMKISKEIGDVLWYLGALSTSLGIELSDCAELNREKLVHRHGAKGYNHEDSALRRGKEKDFSSTTVYKKLASRITKKYEEGNYFKACQAAEEEHADE